MAGEQLRVTEGNADGERIAVDGDVLIGRAAEEAAGRLGDDPELSRRHARAWRGVEGELRIEDLGSANGTFVNDERLEGSRTLHVGDVVRMGQTPRGAPRRRPSSARRRRRSPGESSCASRSARTRAA
jgi:pSer/pThr/pTyr-binding forkhead associated (FHA) protein